MKLKCNRLWFLAARWPVPEGPATSIKQWVEIRHKYLADEFGHREIKLMETMGYKTGTVVYWNPRLTTWDRDLEPGMGWGTREEAEAAGFKLVTENPLWIGKVEVRKVLLGRR